MNAGKDEIGRRKSAGVFSDTVSAPPEVKKKHEVMAFVRFGAVFALLVLIILALLDVIPIADTLTDSVVGQFRDLGAGGVVLYILIAAAFATICMPSSLLALSAGYIWESTGYGFLASHPGILGGAMISFTLGRELFKEWLETELRGVMKFDALSQASKEKGFLVVFFGRISPIPFGLINYALSVSKITYLQFFAASFIGLIPISVGYSKVGADFYTFFETQEVRLAFDNCQTAIPMCCDLKIYPKHAEACKAVTASQLTDTGLITCLGQNKCDLGVLSKEAADLNCAYNDCEGADSTIDSADNCAVLELLSASNTTQSESLDHANCLRDLNSGMLWPKIVLPVALFLTLLVMGFFGKRALDRGGYLQVQYNIDRQRELLLSEQEAERKALAEEQV